MAMLGGFLTVFFADMMVNVDNMMVQFWGVVGVIVFASCAVYMMEDMR